MKTSLPRRRSIVSIQTNNLLPCLFLVRVPNSHEKTITGLDVCRIRESIFNIIETNIIYIYIYSYTLLMLPVTLNMSKILGLVHTA